MLRSGGGGSGSETVILALELELTVEAIAAGTFAIMDMTPLRFRSMKI